MGWTIFAIAGLVLFYFFGRRMFAFMVKAFTGDLGLPEYGSINLQHFKATFQFRMLERDKRASEHAKLQARNLGQIDGQLYAPSNWAGNPFRPEVEEECCYVELVGHKVSIYDEDDVYTSTFIHPQDTILEIMGKINISPKKVLYYQNTELEDLDMTLMEYGIPDNRKVDLVLKERGVLGNGVEEIFQSLY
jgi:hypothetical protein